MSEALNDLISFMDVSFERGACRCGRCADAPTEPEKHQPNGHTVNLTFFEMSLKGQPDPKAFKSLVEKALPNLLDGEEHNYLQLGAEVGDQGRAICLIGLGHLLGLWKALSPDTIMPFLDQATKQTMAGQGFLSLQAKNNDMTPKQGESQ